MTKFSCFFFALIFMLLLSSYISLFRNWIFFLISQITSHVLEKKIARARYSLASRCRNSLMVVKFNQLVHFNDALFTLLC